MPERCLCGNTELEISTREGFVTSGTGQSMPRELALATCPKCLIVRQVHLPFQTEEECLDYYKNEYPPVGDKYSIKNYGNDLDLARKRFSSYRIDRKSRLLDIGSGSGAFIDVCRGRGIEAVGCEIGEYHYSKTEEFTYQKRFEDVHFPTDHFGTITCHDVVEHVLDPVGFLAEVFRVMDQGGVGFIEIPDFFHEKGAHHWKYAEHIWFFTLKQFSGLLEDAGFKVVSVNKPVEAKAVFKVQKPAQARPSILLPPGIGDSYWELVKLEAFLERENLGLPDIYIASRHADSYNAHDRAFPFIRMVPFVHSADQVRSIEGKSNRPLWREAYCRCGNTVFPNVAKCDYFISHNGYMGKGFALDKVDPDLKCHWDIPLFVSLEQEAFRKQVAERYGKYVVFYFVFQGTYQHWVKEFPLVEIISYIKFFAEKTGYTPILVGAPWDASNRVLRHLKKASGCVDLLGKTTLDEVFGLMRGAEMVVGFPSGLTILSTVLGAKTLIIWNDYYNSQFAWNSCPPYTKDKTYFTVNTKSLTVEKLMVKSMSVLDFPPVKIEKKAEKRSVNGTRTVACVLRSGGDFTLDYVVKLKNAVARNTTVPHDFVCLTDMDIDPSICRSVKLEKNWPGWWSKVELFRSDLTHSEIVIYFDLDTVITGNIDKLLQEDFTVAALRPWNKKNLEAGLFASGIMAWRNSGTYSFIYEKFDSSMIERYNRGDQQYISETLADYGETPKYLQSLIPGIYSYKRNCNKGLPEEARIVCFHGRPRPHQLNQGWVKENWR